MNVALVSVGAACRMRYDRHDVGGVPASGVGWMVRICRSRDGAYSVSNLGREYSCWFPQVSAYLG